jgi:predicted PurR-regulated permease PerM
VVQGCTGSRLGTLVTQAGHVARAACGRWSMPAQLPVKLSSPHLRINGFFTLATFVLVVAILKIAEAVVIPIALTVLLTFLLTPFVVRLTRVGFPKPAAIGVTVFVTFSIIGAVGWVITTQAVALARQLPDYEENIREKVQFVQNQQGPGGFERVREMIRTLQKDLAPNATEPRPAPDPDAEKPAAAVPVEVRAPAPSTLQTLRDLVGPLLEPLGTAAIVIVFVIALLFQREDMRDRFIKVISAGRLNLATQALDDAARRVTRYLFMQLVVNASYGIPVGIGLHLIGIPNALLWGVLATLLRFIPFLGPWIAAAFPIALAAAVDPGWTQLIYTLALFVVMEVLSNNVVEPWLYGASTGISNLALMVAAVFWTWLWGVPGLFLSTPLTVCIMVLGKHVPGLQFISVLLGSEPVLEPAARFYQRMLSMDSEEMLAQASKFIEEHSLEAFYNDVFVPALFMSEQDRHNGTLAEVRQKFIFESSRELIEELERRSEAAKVQEEEAPPATNGRWINDRLPTPVVFGLPARDDADEVVAHMLQHLLRLRGVESEIVSATTRVEDASRWIQQHRIPVTVISALPPAALFGARQLCRRLKERCPETKLVVGVWAQEANVSDMRMRLRRPAPDAIVSTLGDAVRQIEKLLHPEAAQADKPAETDVPSETSHQRDLAEASAQEQMSPRPRNADPDEEFGSIVRDLARHFEIPVSLVSILAADAPYWKAHAGVSGELSTVQEANPATQPLHQEETLLVEDITKDRRFASHPSLLERGVRFFASVPLRSAAGSFVGCLTIVDTKPRQLNEDDRKILELRSAELMEAVENITQVPPRESVDSRPPIAAPKAR